MIQVVCLWNILEGDLKRQSINKLIHKKVALKELLYELKNDKINLKSPSVKVTVHKFQ